MKIIVLKCPRCQAILTNQLKEFQLYLTLFNEWEEIIERGHYSNGHSDISSVHQYRILINHRDSKLLNHKQLKNYMGCCGYYDTDFLNQICPNCGLGIATLVTECYTYNYIAFDKNKVIIKEIKK